MRNIGVMRRARAVVVMGLIAGALTAPAASPAAGKARALPFTAKLIAPTHTPKANTKWLYTVRVTDLAGTPIGARITVQIVDPSGTAHPATFDNTTKPLVRWPIVGVFHDYAEWPPSARGFPLTFRVIVFARGARLTLNYVVRVR